MKTSTLSLISVFVQKAMLRGRAMSGERQHAPLLLTTKEAARLMRLSNRTLEDWRVRGKGPPFCKLGAAVRYAQADVQLFLSAALRANTGGFPA